jgi:pimeloyl-ACP methyl ester carboxylesterase
MNAISSATSGPVLSRREFAALLLGGLAGRREPLRVECLVGPKPFLLVHGAWHGGWCWDRVAPVLRRAGHEVYTPTLTGLGDRAAAAAPDVGLSTHIQDVVRVLEAEDLQQVILVGHSYAGFVITGVAQRARGRLARLVFLDAFLPEDGQSVRDYQPPDLDDIVRRTGDGWRLPMTALFPVEALGLRDTADLRWVRENLRDQPYRTFTERLRVSPDTWRLPCTYVLTSEAPPFLAAAARARKQGFRVVELAGAGHDAMITHPTEVSRTLLHSV